MELYTFIAAMVLIMAAMFGFGLVLVMPTAPMKQRLSRAAAMRRGNRAARLVDQRDNLMNARF